jgi:hypothetical protein
VAIGGLRDGLQEFGDRENTDFVIVERIPNVFMGATGGQISPADRGHRMVQLSMARRALLGVLLIMIGTAGCGAAVPPTASTQEECERSGGKWRSGTCERSVGGGY